MGDDEDPEEPYVYSSKPGGSSMYAAVERVLAARPDWISAKSASSFDLLIAERWAIPHSRLGRDGFGGTPSRVPLTNHTRGSKAITVKGLMVKSLRALCETVPGAADFLPETYLVTPGEASDAAERAALLRTPRTEDECWICKPTGGAHGVGIEICRDARDALRAVDASHRSDGGRTETREDDEDLSDGKSVVRADVRAVFADDTKDAPKPPQTRGFRNPKRVPLRPRPPPAWLVQRYVANPMLVDGRKFDVRFFALVTHDKRVFWFTDWIVRTCSELFDMRDVSLANRTAHISNHCVQTRSDKFGAFEEGNEMFAKDFLDFLQRKLPGSDAEATRLFESVVKQMTRAVARTVACVIDAMGGGDAYDAFQVLGYDFMPDENGKVWLLEVNGSPAAAERMTPRIAEDLVELAVDAKFPPRLRGRGEKGAVASGRWVELDLACE
jgi:tubulin--tyrosine ligase